MSIRQPLATIACFMVLSAARSDAAELPAPPVPVTLPAPAPNAFSVSVAFGPSDGLMYVWTGNQVLKQDGPLATTFSSLGSGSVGSGSSDAGPMVFSRDGSQLLIGNGAGGNLQDVHNGQIFKIPASGGSSNTAIATVPFHSDFTVAPLGSSTERIFINQSAPTFAPSTVTVFDFSTSTPTNSPVVQNIPGASAGMAVHGGQLYVGVGFGPAAGHIRTFSLAAIETALNTSTPLDWTAGALFNGVANNSGFGMFFDARGYLFAGGPNGIAVFDPLGNVEFFNNNGFTDVDYDPFNDRVLVSGFGQYQGLYPATMFVPEPATWLLLLVGAGASGLARWRRRAARNR